MPQEIFDSKEIEENQKKLGLLVELIRSKSAVLFVGAGCSIRVGYPSWSGLLDELERLTTDFTKDESKKKANPLAYADDIKDNIKKYNAGSLDKYHGKLGTLFGPKTKAYDGLHQILVSLKFKGIVTTNYDPAIEAALSAQNSGKIYNSLQIKEHAKCFISEFFLSLDSDGFPKHVLHSHGVYTYPNEIILTLDEYAKAYGFIVSPEIEGLKEAKEIAWSLHRRILWALLATRRLVFVGFSFDDPYFEHMLRLSANDFWRWDSPIHFAVIPISSENADKAKRRAELLRREYGIETYFYIDHDDKHAELYKVIAEIANACGVSISPDWVADWNDKVGGI